MLDCIALYYIHSISPIFNKILFRSGKVIKLHLFLYCSIYAMCNYIMLKYIYIYINYSSCN